MAIALVTTGFSSTPATAAPSAGAFISNGDRVHVSSTPPRTASAHAWWIKVSGPGTKAKVTIWLQTKTKNGKWRSVAKGSKTVKPGGGSSRRANARKTCANAQKTQWRTMIDVDIIGVNDTPEKAYTAAVTVKCGL
ncbi:MULTISPECIES: hypothetical protein [Streptomyces]|uniref:hypothetical protein n=1 Tax=Streptomyces TaxID=1883 RepID=UPI001E51F219|nr:hypothetical protein [Streptomyces ruber]